jgi:hypothetical protein
MAYNGARVCDVARRAALAPAVAACRKPAVKRSPRSGEPDCGLARAPLGKSRVADFA